MDNRSRSASPTNRDDQDNSKIEYSAEEEEVLNLTNEQKHAIINAPYSPTKVEQSDYYVEYSPSHPKPEDKYNIVRRRDRDYRNRKRSRSRSRSKRRRDNGDTDFRFNGCKRCGFAGHSSRDCSIIQCSKCRGYGHRQRDCVTIVCINCERLGHTSNECRERDNRDKHRREGYERDYYDNRNDRSSSSYRNHPYKHNDRDNRDDRKRVTQRKRY